MRTILRGGVVAGCLLLLSLAGCGASSTYTVSGVVTYGGKPLPEGGIAFQPADDSPGPGARPATGAVIVNGKYTTPPGKGIGGGPYIVRITPPVLGSGTPITPETITFPVYETKIDFPMQNTTHDFAVPAHK